MAERLGIFMQVTHDGARLNCDGNGRNASDNNSLYAFAWLMF